MGEDMKRAFAEGSSFEHPGGITLLESMSEFLDMKEPRVFSKTVLLAPALPAVLTDGFLGGLLDGSHRFMDFHDAEDVKTLFRHFLWTETFPRQDNDNDNRNANANGDSDGDASQT